MKNNDFDKEILKLINKHIGKSNPIKVEEIMKAIPLSDREIRRIVQYLINEGNNPIGSTTRGPYGFYMIADFDDYLEAIRNLSSRKKKLVERVEQLRQSCLKHGVKVPRVEINEEKNKTTFNISNSVVIYFK